MYLLLVMRHLALLVVLLLALAGCGSSSGGSGGSGGDAPKKGSVSTLNDGSTCTDWNAATLAAQKAYIKPLQPRAHDLSLFNYVRDTCGSLTDKFSSDAMPLRTVANQVISGP